MRDEGVLVISADRHMMCEVEELRLVKGFRWKLIDGVSRTVLKKYDSEGDAISDLLYVASQYEDGEKVVYL